MAENESSLVVVTTAGEEHGSTELRRHAFQVVKSRAAVAEECRAFEDHLEYLHRLGLGTNVADVQGVRDRLLHEDLRVFLAEQGILVYDSRQVRCYLDEIVRELQGQWKGIWRWFWRPLRKCDVCGVRGGPRGDYRDVEMGGWVHTGEIYDRCALMPDAALYTFKKIRDGFPAAHFFVSDFIKERKNVYLSRPDPFLAVAVPRTPFLVVEFWNEPGFSP